MRTGALIAALVAAPVVAWDVAGSPPMGWNSWNLYGCSVNNTILMNMATAMAANFKSAGYEYINSDDCWMLKNRSASGNQVANPDKFPDGFAAVTAFIHGLGLKSGLYTAKGPNTCAGFAASCNHEAQDALQWASWGIDYVKDDSCSSCGSRTDNDLYHSMWEAIEASGRPMVLTVEGNPDDALLSAGGLGNAKRVGHDISPLWGSMLSLVDIGAGLWPFAHNSTNATFGGYFNDLDMIEVGNAPDFVCGQDNASLARCQTHFTMWTIMKAPLILGNDLADVDPVTLSVLVNAEAISVNQDALGVQARRVAVYPPSNSSIGGPRDTIAVVAPCDASRPTQTWHFQNSSSGARNQLYLVPCAAGDAWQQWDFVAGPGATTTLRNRGAGMCVDAHAQFDPGLVVPCAASSPSQQWSRNATTGHVSTASGNCLDVYMFTGPDVEIGGCKAPGNNDGNQDWALLGGGAQLSPLSVPGSCLGVTAGPAGGSFYTNATAGDTGLCLENTNGAEGTWVGTPCVGKVTAFVPVPANPNAPPGPANYTLPVSGGGGIDANNQTGASGPWPHTRYVTGGWSWGGQGGQWTLDLAAAAPGGAGTTIKPAVGPLLDDDLVGGVGLTSDLCLDLQTSGTLEVWAGPLTGGRIAVALFNRSPGPDSITATWADIGAQPGRPYAVRDIWAAADRGSFTGSYTATGIPTHATAFLILTPQ